ncbi:MAG: SUMF1/EgtB/PvdO family nonheme iron enzyme [Bacteroidota bacterium]
MIRIILTALLFVAACNPAHTPPDKRESTNLSSAQETPSRSLEPSNKYTTGDKYLAIEEVKRSSGNRISFQVSWDASWRSGGQYDAAWVFVKSKEQGKPWQHANIRPSTAKVEVNDCSDGAAAALRVSPDQVGIMISRKNDGQGDNDWTISLALEDVPKSPMTQYQVFGLEMIHVPSGAFELGTLKCERDRNEELTPGAGGAPYNPFFTFQKGAKDNYGGIFNVTSENPIEIGKENGNLFWLDADIRGANTFSGTPNGTLSTNFPKGFAGFYQMKYELSQQAYCDFLNTLTPEQQKSRDITQTIEFRRPIADYRNAILFEEGIFRTNRSHRPCNFLSWLDGQAYADWAGLRHMTELEFEKACRGTQEAVYREYVWGVNEVTERQNMRFCTTIYQENSLAKEESGRVTIDGNVHASMFSYQNFIDVCTLQGNFYDPDCRGCRSFTGGDGGRGPVRQGIFGVTSDGSRIRAGATFYGAMEMGGNLQEPVVTVGHPSGRKFEGTHGDGTLTASGFSDNLDWQPVNNEYGFGGRGGCWKFHENHARTSDRFKGLRTNPNRRASHIGFRGVRTGW